ncbi:hypothetical protein GCM10022244_17790 [Streptomyces gulbargensis]|uniref:Uncharacterized protein n=1 Tax=Streptomyces gulbargensis TaxID=364901 RepID=A0ABP7LTB8_9ACTN
MRVGRGRYWRGVAPVGEWPGTRSPGSSRGAFALATRAHGFRENTFPAVAASSVRLPAARGAPTPPGRPASATAGIAG